MTHRARQGGDGGVAGDTSAASPRRAWHALLLLAVVLFACGDPSDPDPTVGTLTGTVHDAETDVVIAGVALTISGREGVSGSDGAFEIDSVPVGTQQMTASRTGYVTQQAEVEIAGGATATLLLELVADLGPPGPGGVTATTDGTAPGTVTVGWSPVAGATNYTVYWGTHSPASAEQGTAVANAPNPFVHTELSKGTTYYYTVVAQTAEGSTRPSAEVSATPDGPISIAFVNPTPTQIVGARFVVSVEIRSVFQLTSVTAQVESVTDELTYIPASDEWEGFFDVGDLPSPTFRTVHYTATDAAGERRPDGHIGAARSLACGDDVHAAG